MGNNLTNWEIIFEQTLQRVAVPKRKEAGALLSVIPDHAKWDEFLATVKAEWNAWRGCLEGHAICLIVLYGGLAYYEYDEKTFWPHFAKAVGSELIFPNQQTEINRAFSKAAELLGFPIHHKVVSKTVGLLGLEIPIQDATTSYVGSAVYHIGIPLSLWDGFLEICEWAWWRDDWNSLTADEWVEIVRRRTGGRNRLKKFLIENREITGALIKEMLDARKILSDDASLTIADLSKACLLRTAYFDEVPETAEFLRPQDPESLLHDRPQLVWNDQRSCICLNLPGLPQNKLPATWHIDSLLQDASSTPHQLVLNSVAFQPSIHLKLVSGQQTETQRLRGVQPWGFFDLDAGGQLVNSDREQLPLRSYALVSRQRIESITRVGFDEEENPVNEPFELGDGMQC